MREAVGSGGHGTVFRAVRADQPEGGSYALKVARKAGDERFEREAWLLSRVRHRSVPNYEDSGSWRSPRGEVYPYVVMEWVEGVSLYAWAVEHEGTLRQGIGQLAQVARALEATHEHGVHRDVKGGNVRVSAEGHAVLLDFGCCWYPGASPLTGRAVPPGSDEYRSPGLRFYEYALRMGAGEHYEAEPEDDVYALGVTAYRLLAGVYPPRDTGSRSNAGEVARLQALRGLAEVCPELGELIVRLLSEDPKARGSAREVAEELEALREYSRPGMDEPWRPNVSQPRTGKARPPAPREEPPKETWSRLAFAGACLVLLVVVVLAREVVRGEVASGEVASAEREREQQATENPEAGASVCEEVVAQVAPDETPPLTEGEIASEIPEKPGKDQKRPPCTRWSAKEINGGCWLPVEGARAPCSPGLYEHEGRCYYPVSNTAARPPTTIERR